MATFPCPGTLAPALSPRTTCAPPVRACLATHACTRVCALRGAGWLRGWRAATISRRSWRPRRPRARGAPNPRPRPRPRPRQRPRPHPHAHARLGYFQPAHYVPAHVLRLLLTRRCTTPTTAGYHPSTPPSSQRPRPRLSRVRRIRWIPPLAPPPPPPIWAGAGPATASAFYSCSWSSSCSTAAWASPTGRARVRDRVG